MGKFRIERLVRCLFEYLENFFPVSYAFFDWQPWAWKELNKDPLAFRSLSFTPADVICICQFPPLHPPVVCLPFSHIPWLFVINILDKPSPFFSPHCSLFRMLAGWQLASSERRTHRRSPMFSNLSDHQLLSKVYFTPC